MRNSHAKFVLISSNGIGYSMTDGRVDYNIPFPFLFKKRRVDNEKPWSLDRSHESLSRREGVYYKK